MKATEQYFPTTLFTLYKAVPNLETVHEIVMSDTAFKIKSWAGSKERCCFISAVLYRAVFYKTVVFFFLILIAGTQGICNPKCLKGSPLEYKLPCQAINLFKWAREVRENKETSFVQDL